MAEAGKETMDKAFEAVEVAKTTGKVKKGINEVTKSIERGDAKLVLYAKDVNPKEIVMHIPPLCKEKEIPCFEVSSREDLGVAAGVGITTSAVSIVKEGEAKQIIKQLKDKMASEE